MFKTYLKDHLMDKKDLKENQRYLKLEPTGISLMTPSKKDSTINDILSLKISKKKLRDNIKSVERERLFSHFDKSVYENTQVTKYKTNFITSNYTDILRTKRSKVSIKLQGKQKKKSINNIFYDDIKTIKINYLPIPNLKKEDGLRTKAIAVSKRKFKPASQTLPGISYIFENYTDFTLKLAPIRN